MGKSSIQNRRRAISSKNVLVVDLVDPERWQSNNGNQKSSTNRHENNNRREIHTIVSAKEVTNRVSSLTRCFE
eukprot:10924478-Ditylum_brightwellii.AAC.1